MLGTVRRELQQLEPAMPLLNVNTSRTVLSTSVWAPRMGASLLTTFGGVVAGLAASLGLAQWVTNLLYGVTGSDPITFTLVPAVLLIVAALATYLPARKASRVDPVEAIRI